MKITKAEKRMILAHRRKVTSANETDLKTSVTILQKLALGLSSMLEETFKDELDDVLESLKGGRKYHASLDKEDDAVIAYIEAYDAFEKSIKDLKGSSFSGLTNAIETIKEL